MTVIEVDHVSKEFRLGELQTMKRTALNVLRRLRGAEVKRRAPFKALSDVSFKIEAGESIGIIGHNGAGKSTLLKLLAGITQPTRGRLNVIGRVAPLIEVGAGLVPDLTGRENIYLNAAILGMKRAEIRRKFDEIVAFGELEEFIDTPLKRFSSGMQVRLGFAIAASVDSDILIADEVLAVGDITFQRKCYDRMQEMLLRQGRTIILVSHDLREVERTCRRVFLLDHGHLVADGKPQEVCGLFFERSHDKMRELTTDDSALHSAVAASAELEVLDLALLDEQGSPASSLRHEAPFTFRLRFKSRQELTALVVEFGVQTTDFLKVTCSTSEQELPIPQLAVGEHEISCRFDRMPLVPGVYTLWLIVSQGNPSHGVFWGENLLHFQVTQGARAIPLVVRSGFFELSGAWSTTLHTEDSVGSTDANSTPRDAAVL